MSFTFLCQCFFFSVTDPSGGGAAGDLSETSLRAADAEQMRIIFEDGKWRFLARQATIVD